MTTATNRLLYNDRSFHDKLAAKGLAAGKNRQQSRVKAIKPLEEQSVRSGASTRCAPGKCSGMFAAQPAALRYQRHD